MTTLDPRGLHGDATRARKAEILRLAQDAVEHRGETRRARRRAVAMVVLTAGVTLLAVLLAPTRLAGPPSPVPGIGVAAGGPATPSGSPAPATIAHVVTTSGLANALAAGTSRVSISRVATAPQASAIGITRVVTTGAVERIGDTQALALLSEAGTPAGLVRIEGRTTLVYHDAPTTPPGPSGDAGETSLHRPLMPLLATAATYRPG
ncbi:MAG: hypothetical protein ACFCBV_03445 [Phycisphaerales bacterium]